MKTRDPQYATRWHTSAEFYNKLNNFDTIVRLGVLGYNSYTFNEGFSAEEIAQQYPSVPLADVYYVIGYYLKRASEVESYLTSRELQAEQVRKQNESKFSPLGVRERLLARWKNGML